MIITFSGAPGSGKSTIAEKLANDLNLTRYYMGGLRREAAKKRGLSLEEYNKLGEEDPKTDTEVDEYQKELGKTQDNFIIEGRTSWYFIPKSLKIYLDVSLDEGARRVFLSLKAKNEKNERDERNEGKNLESLEDVKNSIVKRIKSDTKRYKKYYNIDVNDVSHYDYYLDTTNFNQKEVYSQVFEFVKKELDKAKK